MTSLFPALTRSFSGIYLFLFVALAPVPATSASETTPSAAPRAFLWKVEGAHPSWLCGTIHSGDPRVATLPANVTTALAASRSFHPEIELSADVTATISERLFQPG